MGKSRRSRGHAAHRRDPIVKAVKPPSDPELAALREAKILPVIKDLQSADPKSRSTAASAIANIVQDTRCRKLLLREQVVHTLLSQTLTDSALESRVAGWGILRLLAQEEDADFCVHLFRLDILTAIEYASKTVTEKISSENPKFSSMPKAEQASITSMASSLVSLVTALAEAQDDVLDLAASNAAITRLLFTLITYNQDEADGVVALRTDALACLMILCEDNEKLAGIIFSEDRCLQILMSLRNDANSDGVLACAILHNVFESLDDSIQQKTPNTDDSILIPTLAKTIASVSPDQAVTNGHGWSSPVEYQQLALEILASIGTSLNAAMGGPGAAAKEEWGGIKEDKDDEDMHDDEEMGSGDEDDDKEGAEDEAEDEAEDDEEMNQDEIDADMDMINGDDDDAGAENIDDLPILQALLKLALPQLLRVTGLQLRNDDIIRLQSHALSALNNIAWSISLVDFSADQNRGIQKAWEPCARSIWETVITPVLSSDTADLNLATQVTGLAWAVARSLRGKTPLQDSEHRKFISLYQATKGAEGVQNPEDPFQGLGVKCIGVLGQLALHPVPTDRNREIGTFFMTLLAGLPETPAADAVETLNQVFDIYCDEDFAYDKEVFWKDNYIKHLEDALPKTRALAKGVNKKDHPELRNRADEAVLNLNRLIVYKRKHKP